MRQNPRLGGAVIAAIGLFLGKLTIYDVWREACASAPSLSVHMKGVVISITCVLGGLAMIVAGPAVQSPSFRNPESNKLTPSGYLILFLLLAPAFGFYGWFEHKLGEMGYNF